MEGVMEQEKKEYRVKIKDHAQDITHVVHELGVSRADAEDQAIVHLRDLLGHTDLEVTSSVAV